MTHHATDSTRRAMLASLAALPVGTAAKTAEPPMTAGRNGDKMLVAYFSRTGNTRVIAGLLHRSLGAELFEIQPAQPYPDDYLQTVEQARQERDGGHARAVARSIDLKNFDTVFLGFPIWGETVPPVVRSFLAGQALEGKRLIPFITHGGYGAGNSQTVLASYIPKGTLLQGLVMEADQERRTMNQVNSWVKTLTLRG
ncbi:MAG: flavodoxin [Ottowia sp.]|nr:flavodoxin [Ottowia sp.]